MESSDPAPAYTGRFFYLSSFPAQPHPAAFPAFSLFYTAEGAPIDSPLCGKTIAYYKEYHP